MGWQATMDQRLLPITHRAKCSLSKGMTGIGSRGLDALHSSARGEECNQAVSGYTMRAGVSPLPEFPRRLDPLVMPHCNQTLRCDCNSTDHAPCRAGREPSRLAAFVLPLFLLAPIPALFEPPAVARLYPYSRDT
ncbi:hypothetical protein KCV07_g190, partial [Aureobasidium melanogenum]